jgi:hypothetical protein
MKINRRIGVVAGLVLAGVISVSMLFTSGCVNPSGGGGINFTSTNTVNVVSNYISLFVSEAVTYGMKQDAATTTNSANATIAAVEEVLGGSDYSPGALGAAFQKLPIAILQSPLTGIITTAVEGVYQLYWAVDVQGMVNGDYVAKSYLNAVIAGIKVGESGNVPPLPLATLKRPVPTFHRK